MRRGGTVLELLIVLLVLAGVVIFIMIAGWGLAFGFASKVVVPWLGIAAPWVTVATLAISLFLAGAGATIVAVALTVLAFLVLVLIKAILEFTRKV